MSAPQWGDRVSPIDMKGLLETMFRGWVLHEQRSAAPGSTQLIEQSMTEVCGGDERAGRLLSLFGEWGNDIIAEAAYYGLALARRQPDGTLLHDDGTIDTVLLGGTLEIVHIPSPPPSPEHYWHKGAWQAPPVEAFDKPDARNS